MKKSGYLIVLLVVIIAGALAIFRYTRHPISLVESDEAFAPTNSPVSASPIPTISDSDLLKTVMASAISAKNHFPVDSITISISQLSGGYAKGLVNSVTPGPGGGLWFAAKVNGTWKLVWDGNGIITCDNLTPFPDFPSSLIPQCFATSFGKMVTR
jgi:hypothetical protein